MTLKTIFLAAGLAAGTLALPAHAGTILISDTDIAAPVLSTSGGAVIKDTACGIGATGTEACVFTVVPPVGTLISTLDFSAVNVYDGPTFLPLVPLSDLIIDATALFGTSFPNRSFLFQSRGMDPNPLVPADPNAPTTNNVEENTDHKPQALITISYFNTSSPDAIGTDTIMLVYPASAPEPSTWALALGGLALLGWRTGNRCLRSVSRGSRMPALPLVSAVLLFAGLANAQSNQTWVASTGNDANNCQRATPCRTFTGAYSKTNNGGSIYVVDAADYGPFGIGKTITVDGNGVGMIYSGTIDAIAILSGSFDQITIRNLSIQLFVNASSFCGINAYLSGSSVLNIENVTIVSQRTQHNGICVNRLNGTLHPDTRVNLRSVSITGTGTGVDVNDGTLFADRLSVVNAGGMGLNSYDSNLVVRDSVFRNIYKGINVESTGAVGTGAKATIERCEISSNTYGLLTFQGGGSVTVRLSNSVVTGNNYGIYQQQGSTVVSFRNNLIADNVVDGTPALSSSLK